MTDRSCSLCLRFELAELARRIDRPARWDGMPSAKHLWSHHQRGAEREKERFDANACSRDAGSFSASQAAVLGLPEVAGEQAAVEQVDLCPRR